VGTAVDTDVHICTAYGLPAAAAACITAI